MTIKDRHGTQNVPVQQDVTKSFRGDVATGKVTVDAPAHASTGIRALLPTGTARERAAATVWALTRVVVGWTFLWAFLDKLFGLGYATPSERSWLDGGSPTEGFLQGAATGPFADVYRDIAGQGWADWLFMLGLAGIGVAMLLGIGMRIAGAAGALLYLMMWTVVLPPVNNPVLDEHVLGAVVVAGLALANAGDAFGLGRLWAGTSLVRKLPWLR